MTFLFLCLFQWLSDRKKSVLQQKDVDIQRRIELIQDFEMPTVCTSIRVSRDGQFILAAVYNRCYDTYQLSLKFERCLESDVVTFDILSEDSKLVFLHIDRYVEFHSQHGHYYKTRIPKFGRDFSYHYPSSDLYFVGASSEVFRLNLEQGRFLHSLLTDAAEINVCDINPVHQFFAAGTLEGRVDCWDPRVRSRVGVLDCALSSITNGTEVEGLPSVSALKFNGSLGMAVGTSTGQVLVYDLRSSRTLLVKDHYYGLPIKSLHFHNPLDLVLSADSKIIKMWNKDNGKVFSSIEPQANINDVCLYPGSGMLFTANEDPKMNTFYIPALGPAPRWCSFLENLTEELGENPESTIYDDYKFVTRKANLGKAYMHGFFMDIRLDHKVQPHLLQDEEEEEVEGRGSSEEEESSDDDDKSWVQEVREQRRLIRAEERERTFNQRKERRQQDRETSLQSSDPVRNRQQEPLNQSQNQPRFYQIKAGEAFRSFGDAARKQKMQKTSLEERLQREQSSGRLNFNDTAVGSKQLTFTLKKTERQRFQQQAERDHHEERRKIRWAAGHLHSHRGGRGRGGGRGRRPF
uniref:Nucleolar protein 10 n=1 Tax=Sinocyclocheilus grahami TaxID=75366 RepID=A0A672RAW7_SINGR